MSKFDPKAPKFTSVEAGCEGGKFCFVATTAFGSYDHTMVKKLRVFSDKYLALAPGGETLIGMYYAVGPILSIYVKNSPVLRGAVRGGLTVIATATAPLSILGPSGTAGIGFIILLGLCAFVIVRRKKAF